MKRSALYWAGALLTLAGCADSPGGALGPDATRLSASGAGGYTWTVTKTLQEVHTADGSGGMPLVPGPGPFAIPDEETRWFTFRITYTRTEGGSQGATADITDNGIVACASVGAGFSCTSPDGDLGVRGGNMASKTWTVSATGYRDVMIDIKNETAVCPYNRTLTNTVSLVSNGIASTPASASVGILTGNSAPAGCTPPPPPPPPSCTRTQGYWKNHPEVWANKSLTLGSVTYTQTEILSILRREVNGNGLVSLAYQLIAAKLNGGANDPTIASTIAAADALIGSRVIPPVGTGYLAPSVTDAIKTQLDTYNNGRVGPPKCN